MFHHHTQEEIQKLVRNRVRRSQGLALLRRKKKCDTINRGCVKVWMYSRGRVQGVRVCVNLSLVCAAASSGAESSWARSCSAQLGRGTLEITPETGREEHHRLCLRGWEGSRRHDTTPPAFSPSTRGCPCTAPTVSKFLGDAGVSICGQKGETPSSLAPKVSRVQFYLWETLKASQTVLRLEGETASPPTLRRWLDFCCAFPTEVELGEGKTKRPNLISF